MHSSEKEPRVNKRESGQAGVACKMMMCHQHLSGADYLYEYYTVSS
jgi:hypothetical protein